MLRPILVQARLCVPLAAATPIAVLIAAALFAARPAAASPGPESMATREADRLWRQAQSRRTEPGGAVDLIRLSRLARWLPAGLAERRLALAAADEGTAPLGRAVARWLARDLARRTLDMDAAWGQARALALQTGFAVRSGEAPHPTAILKAADWRAYPESAGTGAVWLDAFVRPARDATATLATRLVAPGGPAVIRIGYDDRVRLILNGDEVYVSSSEHTAWIDQSAIPVVLREGDNRLVVEVGQSAGSWRFILRVTDAEGRALEGISTHPDPWGPCPDPAEGSPPEDVAHLWTSLSEASAIEPPDPIALRDMADYARRSGLPDREQAVERVTIEGAWEVDPSPLSLRAWLGLLPDAERASVRAAHVPPRPIRPESEYADASLAVAEAWDHYYARRFALVRETLEVLEVRNQLTPSALRLRAVLNQELGLPNVAAADLAEALALSPGPRGPSGRTLVPGLRRAEAHALREAGRTLELLRVLEDLRGDGIASADDLYQLALLYRARGQDDDAVALLDRVSEARPELWAYALEAAEIRLFSGQRAEARTRMETLLARMPRDPFLLERLARLDAAEGHVEAAVARIRAALGVNPGHADLRRYLDSLTNAPRAEPLGPPLETLATRTSPPGVSAHILYQHARTEVAPSGLADRRFRRVARVLDAEGARRLRHWEVPYVPGSQRLEIEVARRIRDGTPAASPTRVDRDLSEPEYRLYYDLRAEVLVFGGLEPGDLVEVGWRLTDIEADPAFPGYYGELNYLQGQFPRAESIVEIAAAENRVQVGLVDRGLDIERDGLRFVARDTPAVPYEPGMPGASSMRAHVHVSTAEGWDEIDRRYRQLLKGRDEPTEALVELARAWAGDATGARGRVERIHTEVAARTRYVGLELGVHSFQPERPAVTLARGYGDCKDKATLVIALARALGIDAHLALVRTRPAGALGAAPASFAVFDHAIVYVPALDAFVDPTLDRNDPWTLPPSVQGGTAFVIGVDTALRTIPSQPPDHNTSVWHLDLQLVPNGTLRGRVTWTTRGYPATVARRALEADGTRREAFEQALLDLFPGARATDIEATGLSPALDPVTVTADIRLPELPRSNGGRSLPVAGAAWRLVERYAQPASRRTPLQLDFRGREQVELEIALPSGWSAAAPAMTDRPSPFGRFDSSVRVEGRRVSTRTVFELGAFEISPEEYGAFRDWLGTVDRRLADPVALEGAGS